ncbi:GNAT family N-acetyltransferase [Halomonas sp. MCCC 1A11036]|uniref:GNAT family N-acetyltransferase n=1 Tax=Billgrantia zhangzhouensis TaxID=2733481 RepID=A0ABS9AFF6_9GAMM|nr:GNAT family N-acetyltransferase [Halomonas zhangzhouensis]MCE8020437.1 GNAT family N-acetyltransferase [Halomonas zhangzhouensis]
MLIKRVPGTEAPFDLLLEADPSLDTIKHYLERSICHVAIVEGETVGTYVIQPLGDDVHELMNIAVAPAHQRKGIGARLLDHAIATVREAGARRLELGTGTFGYQLTYYQRAGFRVVAVERDYFLAHYDEPIYENGIQHKDRLRLALEF